ncbi:MAG TPA: discoidin domain-containing protein, partial [Pyrinomonadaceae bacterium]|nr:discoidin domain-containing protein [Pyrinomonadaceae bacterium]
MRACYYLSKLFPLILSIFFVSSASAFTCTEPTNVALASNGATATASSAYSGFAASGAINGDRKGLFAWQNGYWSTASAGFPAWLEVQFNGSKTITEIDVVTSQDNYNAPIEPTESTTFTAGGLTAYQVQYWNGSAWATITNGSVSGNDKVWKKFSFAAVTTTKIRVLSSASPDNYSRLTEVEAWTGPSPAPRYNLALGATATASSNWSGWPPSSCVNGDRKSLNAGSNGGWVDAAPANSFPDWLQVDFGANKTINEVDVFTLQDNFAGSSEPTESMTFTQWGLTSYQVEYWNGSSWVAISGASVSGNNKIWRKFSFSPISTSKIRVLTSASVDGYSRITEVEAYAPQASSCQGISRLDPLNATGGGGENPLSQNFNWNVPLVSLPGRAGLDLNLALSYNSLVWTKNNSFISFNEDNGWPGPGFRLGFPVIQQLHYNGETGKYGFILISPDGSRTELRQVGTSVFFEAADSSHLLLDTSDMTLRAADGTQLSYQLIGNQFNCTQIKDRNGNLITTEYVAGRLDKVIDTLGRQIKFNYDGAGLLTSITQTWNQGQPNQASHKWAEFAYTDTTIQTNFVNLTVSGPANNTTIKTLSKVTLADDSHFDFSYTSWGQVWKVAYIASDNVNHVLNYRAYNLPGSPLQPTSAQADCPRFTERRDWVKYWNGDVDGTVATNEEAVTTFSGPVNDTWTMPGDSQSVTGKYAQVTLPDGTVNKTYFLDSSGTPRWGRGLPALVETSSGGNWQRKVKTTWTQDNTSVDYPLNPRVIETNVYDPAGNRARTEITYEQFTFANNLSCSLPKDLKEYAGDAATVLRTTRTNYNTSTTYTDRRILVLPSEELLYDGTVSGTLMSKTEFSYDESGSIPTNDAPSQHDANYHWTFLARGNLTRVRRYDVSNLSQSTSTTMKYNTAGAVVSSKDASDHQVLISYADSYSDGNNSRGTLAYPTTFTDADGYSSTTKYSFDFGGVTYKRTPQPNSTSNAGPEQSFAFDSIGRLQQVTNLVNNAYTRFVYVASQLKVERYTTIESGLGESLSFQVVDGVGRTIASASDHPGSTGGYSGQKFVYDVMGRVIKTSNPTETSASGTPFQWNTVGDDASAGWIYTQQTYDWKNRPRVTTNQDGTTKTILYAGCGCAGGQVTTLSDEGTIDGGIAKRRQKKIYSDVLGRTVKTEYLNWEGGSVYSATVQTYNARDQVTLIRQYAGPEGSGTYQDTTMDYDGYGRLKQRHVPEQDENLVTTWAYNADDTLQSVTDARGASTHFSYNSRHLLTSVAWSVPELSPIPTPATVTYAYDGAGNRTSMMDGLGTVVYEYDSLSRLRSETRTLTGVSNPDSADGKFKLSYDYNLAGQLRKITDASNVSINYGHDVAGRVNSVTGSDSLYANVTQYAGAFSYRAWGALESMTDGTNTVTSRTYNSRLQTQQFVLGNITQNYSYFNDGRIKFVQNLPDSHFDRSFSYDQQARLVSAMSGGAARQDAGSVPYQETFGYDVFSNLNARLTSTWNQYSANDSGV